MKLRNILIALVFLLIAGGLGTWYYLSGRIVYSEDGTIGNTAGNLYNGGLFCEVDGVIYFSNPNDDGALYSMSPDCTDVKKLAKDKVASINADQYYVYYSRRNYAKENTVINPLDVYNTGLYRLKKSNGRMNVLTVDANGVSCLYNNTIYYQHYDTSTATQFYQLGIDGKENTRVSTDGLIPASVYNGMLYYAGVLNDHFLHAMNLEGGNDIIVAYDSCYMPVAMPGGIYYIAVSDNYSIRRVGYDGSEPETLVSEFCSTYNITEDERYLFYQIDGGEDNRIVRLDLRTGMTTTIMDGNFKQIHITSQYVFFRDFADTITYAYQLSSGTLNTFLPPVLD